MTDKLANAREAVERASEVTENSTVLEQLHSIDVGLKEMTEREETTDDDVSTGGAVPHGDDLEEVEEKLVELIDLSEGQVQRHVEDARTAVDEYRRAYTRDWDQ